MSSTQVQEQRKAESIAAAAEAIREAGLPTPRTDVAEAEPLIADEHKIVALLGDMAEGFARLHTAYNHTAGHVDPSQDAEIERLQKRIEELEEALQKNPAKK